MSMKVLVDCLEEFTLTSGLKINKNKSNIFMAGVRPFEKQQIEEMFGFPVGVLPIKHLGLPLSSRKLNIHHYAPLDDQIVVCINRWSNKYFSLAHRMELVRLVLQGVECYWIQMIPLAATIMDRINHMIHRFLWNRNMNPVAWSKTCLPRHEGGLGARDLSTWNKVFMSKIL